MTSDNKLGLYIHIPFCDSICNYCNFNRGLFDSDLKVRYLKALNKEICNSSEGAEIDTLYFGGGTPSLLTPEEVSQLVISCKNSFSVDPVAEITLEANPDSVTSSRLRGWLDAGVNRISFGVQSFRDEELDRLGRRHSSDQAKEALLLARDAGCDEINIDIIFWLPAQTMSHCRESVKTLIDLEPDHASFYMLELYPNAPLKEEMVRSGWSLAPDEDATTMYLETLDLTDAAGYEQYEISNVSRSGKQCRHNLKYWQDGEWLGFGCGAHSTCGGYRWKNVSETEKYISVVTQRGSIWSEHRKLTTQEQLGDALFMGLRLSSGLDLASIEDRYGVDIMVEHKLALEPFLERGLLVHSAGRLRLTRPGMLLANEVMSTFV